MKYEPPDYNKLYLEAQERVEKLQNDLVKLSLTQRDIFAMESISGLALHSARYGWNERQIKNATERAYIIADAMLEAREI